MVSILGDYPAPKYFGVGGVSVHIARLSKKLYELGILHKTYSTIFVQRDILKLYGSDRTLKSKEPIYNSENVPFLVLTPSLKHNQLTIIYWLIRYISFDKAKIIHIHNHLEYSIYFLILHILLKKRILITIHDQMSLNSISQKSKISLTKSLLFRQKKIKWIAVNHNISNQLLKLGVLKKNINVIPAYIKNEAIGVLSDELIEFINSHSPVISIYAVGTSMYKGEDLYGIDMALELIKRLVPSTPNIGIVIVIPGIKNPEIISNYNKFIATNMLENNVFLQSTALQDISQLWTRSHIYLRPTNTDGDALAVREALDSNCVVIASNVVDRPHGCVLFESRNIEDLTMKVSEVMQDFDYYKSQNYQSPDFFQQIVDIYNSII